MDRAGSKSSPGRRRLPRTGAHCGTADPAVKSAPLTMSTNQLSDISRDLAAAVNRLRFSTPVTHVYNPLDYAWPLHAEYLRRFGRGRGRVLLLGMNPGPWGMAQTGVPFGEVAAVRDWMGLSGEVNKPARPHPKRPVRGLDCPRSEVSGRRLWGWAATHYRTAEAFFQTFFVVNYCPLLFMQESGANLTPDKLPVSERDRLYEPCDVALRRLCDALAPRAVVGIGGFAAKRAAEALADRSVTIGQILHPSPANPAANRGWAEAVTRTLVQFGVSQAIQEDRAAAMSNGAVSSPKAGGRPPGRAMTRRSG